MSLWLSLAAECMESSDENTFKVGVSVVYLNPIVHSMILVSAPFVRQQGRKK